MSIDPPSETLEPHLKSILEWLALFHDKTGMDEAVGLLRQLAALREAPVSGSVRLKILDLLYGHAAKITLAQLPVLNEATLPVSRKIRQLVRATQDLLEHLTQDYLNSLSELFDPQAASQTRPPLQTLQRVMQCLSWHLSISYLVAAQPGVGIWQQFHSSFRTCRKLGLTRSPIPGAGRSIEQIYLANLLVAVAQPASFTSRELEFIAAYIERCGLAVELTDSVPAGHDGIFWIDPERDMPAQALSRRPPPPDLAALYFACDVVAQGAAAHLDALAAGKTAAELGLPDFAGSHAGLGVLRRLSHLWGHPAKRKFPRRRQAYRARLCAGLGRLWHLLNAREDAAPENSEWMITNESPDGYAMMHMSGNTEALRVGDIVAIRPCQEEAQERIDWQICIVRWALSENPEHIEVGLQVLAPRAIPAMLAVPREGENGACTGVLLLPKLPPLRPLQALIVPTGAVSDQSQKLIVLVAQDNVAVHELRALELDEQTASIEVFTVEPDETQ